jgi:hypothetical protein
MPPLGPATGLAIAAGEASIDEDVCAQLTAPSNRKSGRTRIVSRMMRLPLSRIAIVPHPSSPFTPLLLATLCRGKKVSEKTEIEPQLTQIEKSGNLPIRKAPARVSMDSLTAACWVKVWMSRRWRCSGDELYGAVPPPAV